MGILLAVLSAVATGAADFSGGMGAKLTRPILVVVWSNAAGLCVALVLSVSIGSSPPGHGNVVWGASAGVSGALSAVLLYWALAHGRMGVVAPTSATVSAALPVVVGISTGDPLTARTGLAFALGLFAIGCVSSFGVGGNEVGSGGTEGRAVLAAVGAGLAFGSFLVLLSLNPDDASLWPLVWARAASLTLFVAVLSCRGFPWATPPRARRLALAGGVLDMGSNALFLGAARVGDLSVVGLLACCYPVSTVLLAALVLRERICPAQYVGVVCAVASACLFSLA